MGCEPSVSAEVVHEALPATRSTGGQMGVVPSRNVTGPLREGSALNTVAVKVTD
jgi:hypothetical protein